MPRHSVRFFALRHMDLAVLPMIDADVRVWKLAELILFPADIAISWNLGEDDRRGVIGMGASAVSLIQD